MARTSKAAAAGWRSALLLVPTVLILAAAGLGGCGPAGKPAAETEPQLSSQDLEQAQRLYAQLKREQSLHRNRKVLEISGSLLDYYAPFPRNDEVLMMAVQASLDLDDAPAARGYVDELLRDRPGSPLVDQALLTGSEIAAAGGDTLGAADYLVRYHDRDPERGLRPDGSSVATPFLKRLDDEDLQQLSTAYPASDLQPYFGFLRTEKLLRQGAYQDAEAVVARLEQEHPGRRWTVAARELISEGEIADSRRLWHPHTATKVNEVGVVCPLTGRYAVLGNAFYDGALLALSHVNGDTGSFVLKVEDSKGDPVASAQAARRLCDEEGSMAIIGALMSATTVSVAVVTEGYGVPLISPTATNDHIWQLGEGVFQTNLTGFFEVGLLAQVAVDILLKDRFAILHPDDDEGRRHAEIFQVEIERLGGEVVANVAFPPQGTDFRDAILEVQRQRPEVIFVPASVDQMILLGPQLDFYRAGALIMGLSNWNSTRLLERAGGVLERAVFPSDLALFPAEWTADFNAGWASENYPREATALALKTYQATRMLLDTLAQSGVVYHHQLTEALGRRMASRDIETEGPESFAPTMRMVRDSHIVSFPAGIFTESWELTRAAAADSLAPRAATPDSLPVQLPDDRELVPETQLD